MISMKLIEFAFKTHFPTAFLKVIFFVFLKFQFNQTGNFFMKQEMWRFKFTSTERWSSSLHKHAYGCNVQQVLKAVK